MQAAVYRQRLPDRLYIIDASYSCRFVKCFNVSFFLPAGLWRGPLSETVMMVSSVWEGCPRGRSTKERCMDVSENESTISFHTGPYAYFPAAVLVCSAAVQTVSSRRFSQGGKSEMFCPPSAAVV